MRAEQSLDDWKRRHSVKTLRLSDGTWMAFHEHHHHQSAAEGRDEFGACYRLAVTHHLPTPHKHKEKSHD